MKIELLINLKTAKGKVIPAGTIITDDDGPISASLLKRVGRKEAKMIDPRPKVVAVAKTVVEVKTAPKESEEVEAPKKTVTKVKKLIKKKE